MPMPHEMPQAADVASAARAAAAFVRPRLRGVLHELSFPLAVLGGAWAIVQARPGGPRLAVAIYAASLCACLGVSALYHRGPWSVRVRDWLRRLDHVTIFMLVAGTFTPIAAIALSGSLSVLTLAVVWGGAAVGSVLFSLWTSAPSKVEVAPYLAIGAVGVVILPHVVAALGAGGTVLLAIGGALYIAGAVIYALHRPNPWPSTFGFHEIFHTLVVAAAMVHWIVITHYVL